MTHLRSILGILAGAAFAVSVSLAHAQDLPRAASVSVCTDQYLLGLADREQIAAVSWQAQSERSPWRARAAGLPTIWGSAEELVGARADVVLFDFYGHQDAASAVARLGARVVRVGEPVTIADIAGETRAVGAALGQSTRAEAMIAEMDRRHAALLAALPEERPLALYISPGGGGAGGHTYIDTVLRIAGYRNLQAELGIEGWQRVPLEQVVETPPDVVVLSFFDSSDPSLLDGFARHPRFRALVAEVPVINMPAAPWVCAGPFIMDAAAHLARERRRLFPGTDQVAEVQP